MSYNFSNHNTLDLAKTYGTPLYVMSQDIIEDRINRLKQSFEKTGIDYFINFAGKSFTTMGICRILEKNGIGLDASSGGELYLALQAGFDPSLITFHGSNKSWEEIREAVKAGVGKIVVDSESELKRLEKILEEEDTEANIFLRINPGVEVHTHEMINTGKIDTKFGIPLDQALKVAESVINSSRIHLVGLHSHIGSQIVEETPFLISSERILTLYKKLLDMGFDELKEINLGGGFGIAYTKNDESFNPETYIPKLIKGLKELCNDLELTLPRISIEPGRYLCAEAGITLYTVGTIKKIEGVRTYLSVDGGMADNPRPALYDAKYEAVICNRELTQENSKVVRICGKACEGDLLIDEIALADPKEGDILAITNTGAYNYTMASNYNKLARPAVVLLYKDQADLLVERETYQDMCKRDRIPEWLR